MLQANEPRNNNASNKWQDERQEDEDDYPSSSDGNSSRSYDEQRQLDIAKYGDRYEYSPRYNDDVWEYRHVKVPPQLVKYLPTDRLMAEEEWRGLGVRQSLGWEHFMIHAPEPNILLFRREKDYQIKYPNGKPNA